MEFDISTELRTRNWVTHSWGTHHRRSLKLNFHNMVNGIESILIRYNAWRFYSKERYDTMALIVKYLTSFLLKKLESVRIFLDAQISFEFLLYLEALWSTDWFQACISGVVAGGAKGVRPPLRTMSQKIRGRQDRDLEKKKLYRVIQLVALKVRKCKNTKQTKWKEVEDPH